MKLVAGLGNPGQEYAATRHNVGFMVADLLAARLGVYTWSRKFKGRLATGDLGGERVILLKPETYMNLSGDSVQPAVAFYRLEPADLVVIHDDVDFELGRLAVKVGGGHGGHKGLRSIGQRLGLDYVRVRLGVGRPARGDVSNHVLGAFKGDERAVIDELVERAADAVEAIIRDGAKQAQNRFNRHASSTAAAAD